MSRSASARARRPSNPNLPIYLLLAGMVALILVALLILPGLSSSGGLIVPTPLARPDSTDNSFGDPRAPVQVAEFSDFQCPFCRRFTEEVEPRLVEEYVQSGKVYFTYRQFPILGEASVRAAEASLCAREQGAFWPYHDILFANQDETNPQSFSDERLADFAEAIGIDGGDLSGCLDERRYAAEVQADAQAAFTAGMNSTPNFLINGLNLTGLLPYSEFARAIDDALGGVAP